MLLDRLRSGVGSVRTNWPQISLNEYVDLLQQFTYNGVQYTLPGDKQEEIDSGLFREVTRAAYKQNGVVFACMLVRMMLFSEARIQYREMNNGRPGKLFGDPNLMMFERPWPGGTTRDLFKKMAQFGDLAGNAYVVRRPGGVRLLRPDWTQILIGSPDDDPTVAAWDVDSEIIGYAYQPGGKGSSRPKQYFLASEVAHFAPIPDPEAQFRGMSWITPLVREIMADKAATNHKLAFFENGATPNLVVKLSVSDLAKFKAWKEEFKEEYEGDLNAYKTMFLGAGADATVVGTDLKQLDFKVTQGAGETRIAAAANVPPIVVGLSEGLQAATYSNYSSAMRRFADLTARPWWGDVCSSLEPIADMPKRDGSVELWYDDRDVPALQEDVQDRAKEMNERATAIFTLQAAGYTRDSVIAAVVAEDLELLVPDPNAQSVQVQPAPAGTPQNGVPPKPGAPTIPAPA